MDSFEEEEVALSNEATAQELRQIQVFVFLSNPAHLFLMSKVAKLNKILAQVVQLDEAEGVVENDF